ncbi:DNA recombination protein RmuC [Adhaeribacter pallidiroseus]|uniref:DNA recombination protein RmuC like protein n=1 Tax=Adhaeribacter pallidiroseus TaxID=2072847 RepID=A0A369QCM1_9BACT|nr:DNA recombination protein RmuC [Adhaeribacter pallidiroseus]RDC62641.1 DNA recombination protein RmuC like protein [Adhaeribacter pallidiroseus]
MEIILAITGFLVGLIGAYLALKTKQNAAQQQVNQAIVEQQVWQTQVQEKNTEIAQLKDQLRHETNTILGLQSELTKTETDLYHLKHKLEDQKLEMEALRSSFLQQFSSVSNQVLVNNAEHFKKASAENLETILAPLKERIKEFETKVDTTYEKSLKENTALKEQITMLAQLNQQMSQDAINLTRALKGERKTQGNWGEYLLEVLLEKSGLKKDEHYRREVVLRNDDHKLYRPDVIVNLPGDKHLIIDSKVSLTAYDAYCNCDDETVQLAHLNSHVQSIRTHFLDLSKKEYHQLIGVNSPDFVLMFISIEPAFNLAMQHDRELFIEALNYNIVFVTTSTLLATLRTVEGVWKQESQKNNVLKIARESGLLYDKFANFVEDLKAIGKSIESSQTSYVAAMNKLTEGKGNLIRKVQQLKVLGARTTKTIDTNFIRESELEPETTPAQPGLLEE